MGSRSTLLKLAADHCPRAVDFAEQDTPRDRDVFAAGIAAHAVLQQLATGTTTDTRTVGDAVVATLTTEGRAFDGVKEPPLPIDACVDGRDLALAWCDEHGVPEGHAELGLAVDENWTLTEYGPEAHYRAVLDLAVVADVETEESAGRVLQISEWKTNWNADASFLDSVQVRGQAILGVLRFDDVDAVSIEIGNLRTRKRFERTIWLDDDGRALLAQWRNDIDLAIQTLDFKGPEGLRPLRPGAGCHGCPYASRCEGARSIVRGTVQDGTPETVALRFAVAKAMADELAVRLRAHASEEPIAIDGGLVGYVPRETREAAPDAARTLAHAWFRIAPEEAPTWDAVNGELLGLLRALDPGVGALTSAATVLAPFDRADPTWKDRRGALINELIKPAIESRFGVHRS